MLEIGQPLHPFDLATLAGKGIVVRRAAEGELVVTLDDVERALTAEDLVIADREKAVAIAGGQAPERRRLRIRPSRASFLLGHPVSNADVQDVFRRLGVATTAAEPDEIEVEVPSYRVDLEREVDLIEEIVRVRGYDTLGTTLPGIRQAGGVAETYALRRRATDALVRAGLRESISLSFASAADLHLMGDT